MKKIFALLVILMSFVLVGCSGNYQIANPQAGKVYRYRIYGGTQIRVMNNVAGTCAVPEVQSQLYSGDDVPTEKFCTGNAAEFFFPNHLLSDSNVRRVTIVFRFLSASMEEILSKCHPTKKEDKCEIAEGDYLGYEELHFTLHNEGSHSFFESLDRMRKPRKP